MSTNDGKPPIQRHGTRIKGRNTSPATKATPNSISGRARSTVELQKQKFRNSRPVQTYKRTANRYRSERAFLHDTHSGIKSQRGFKNKFKYASQAAWRHAKEYNAYKKVQKFLRRITKTVKKIIRHGKWIAAISAIVVTLSNIIIYGMSVAHAIGPSPHYYCELNPSSGIMTSKAYKQYCFLNNATDFSLEEINGHYITQDGSGPCLSCSIANLYLRYFTRNGKNFYDYLWNESGQYPETRQINASIGNTLRTTFNHNSEGTNTKIVDGKVVEKYTNKGFDLMNGVKAFGKKYGYDVTMACWGYFRDSNTSYAGQVVGSAYEDLSGRPNWVFDLSHWNSFAKGSDWTTNIFTGDYIEIEGVKGTLKVIDCTSGRSDWGLETNPWDGPDSLKRLLDAHPSGVFAWREYPKGNGVGHHAILITGYKDDVFYVVDTAKGLYGGFEGPSNDATFCWQTAWSNEDLHKSPKDIGVFWYGWIEEDKP